MSDIRIYPFTSKHLVKFRRELKKEGGFEPLMRQKFALQTIDDMTIMWLYKNKEEYKTRFLTGAYATLRPYYYTEVPYVFWSALYMALVKAKSLHIKLP